MIQWPDDLIMDIARRTCVLYIGAGISANSEAPDGSKPPTWKEFLSKALKNVKNDKDFIQQLLDENDMLTACEIIMEKLGTHEFHNIAHDCFRRPGYKPAEIHEVIYNLDSRLVISPNVDKIYEQYAQTTSSSTVVIKKYSEYDTPNFIRSQDRIILKAHGSIDTPHEMIFSKHQYNEARYKYSSFYKLLDSLALTHTYIFIGCGLNDPDIKLTLENYNFCFPGCRPHYFITSKQSINECISKSLLQNCNVQVLSYDNDDRTHRDLLLSLHELVKKVEQARVQLSGTQNW